MAVTTFERSRRIESVLAHMAGLSLLAIAATVAVSAAVEAWYGDPEVAPMAFTALGMGVVGLVLWRGTRMPRRSSGNALALTAVGVVWATISVAGALPYVLAGVLPFDLGLFESISGFTGAGGTVLVPIEGNGRGLLMYRQLTQWVGGVGVVILAVAVLPVLGIGGLSLMRAESVGPTEDQLANRVTENARRLWRVYLALSGLCLAVLLAVGMSPYDAVAHTASGISTGGFSPYNASIGHFDSALVEAGVTVTMLLGSIKFPLYYAAFRSRDLRGFWRSSELRAYLALVALAIGVVTMIDLLDGEALPTALRHASFNVITIVSTAGFGTEDYTQWIPASQLVLLFLMVTGGMSGATTGGLKVFRVQVALRHAVREVQRVRHPRAVLPVRLGGHAVPEDVVRSILGFVMTYFVLSLTGILALGLLGVDPVTAIGSVVSSIGCVGPGLGLTGPAGSYLAIDAWSRAVLMVLMLAGRLEIFPLLAVVLSASQRLRPLVAWVPRSASQASRSAGR